MGGAGMGGPMGGGGVSAPPDGGAPGLDQQQNEPDIPCTLS
jgi:hypothetical protein